MDLMRKKCAAHRVQIHDSQWTTKKEALKSTRGTVQLKLHTMQDSWLNARADANQSHADKNDMKIFTTVWRESAVLLEQTHLRFCIQMEKSSYKRRTKRWAEHFDGVLNKSSSINNKAINRLPQVPVTWCHSNPWGSSDSYPSTIQWQSTRIWLNSWLWSTADG